ncbi:MAG: prephenate dehydratase [Natronomonas sp.]|jgi:prephenate dehydratase
METVTLGPTGTYSHRAASAVTDDGISFAESVRGIADAVANGDADRGVVPIENSIEGSVTETLDTLADVDLAVVREVVTPVRHALIAQSENFDTVASHSQALAQVRDYLDENYPDADREAVASTAQSVEIARDDPTVAGIAHPDNASDSQSEGSQTASDSPPGDLQVIAEDIQDRTSNSTRFFVVAPPSERSQAGGKSSFVVYPNANYPGLLLELLEPFADRDINLSRVESRPSGERLGDYLFHIDVDAGLYEDRTQAALDEIEAIADDGWVRRLGSYDVEHVV